MKKFFSIILLILFAVFFTLLTIENTELVTFKFYFIQYEVALFVAIIMPFIVGLLLGVVIMSLSVVRNKMQTGKAKKQLTKAEKEVENLRAVPMAALIKDEA